jgi:hypothetical protein
MGNNETVNDACANAYGYCTLNLQAAFLKSSVIQLVGFLMLTGETDRYSTTHSTSATRLQVQRRRDMRLAT